MWVQAGVARRAALGLAPVDDLASALALFTSRLAQPGSFLIVSTSTPPGEVTGCVLAVPARTDDGAGPDVVPGLVHLSCVAVTPEQWGRGAGRALVSAALEHAAQAGFTAVQLWFVATNERARRLYTWAGFEPTGRTKHDDHGEPIEHWRRTLTP